jgi:hypothetical protein
LTLVIAAGGFPLTGGTNADSLVTAALTSPVLTENLDTSLTQNYTTYNARQLMTPSTFGQMVLAMSSHGANSVTAPAFPTQSRVR